MAQYKGIDVSEYQGRIDWKAVRDSGVTFAMLRCGYGRYDNQNDKRFEENYTAAVQAGVHVGAYLFSYAVTPEQAQEEAAHCLRCIAGKRFDYPIAYDVETRAQQNLGTEKLSAIVQAFGKQLEAEGWYVSVYSNLQILRTALSVNIRTRYDIWLAQWASAPTYTGAFGMWQYTSAGTVPGISGPVDLDVAYKNYPAIMRKNALNGYGRAEATQPYAGQKLELSREKLYISSTAPIPTARISGTYYLYGVPAVHDRFPITNRPSRVGQKPEWLHVTGWIGQNALLNCSADPPNGETGDAEAFSR